MTDPCLSKSSEYILSFLTDIFKTEKKGFIYLQATHLKTHQKTYLFWLFIYHGLNRGIYWHLNYMHLYFPILSL